MFAETPMSGPLEMRCQPASTPPSADGADESILGHGARLLNVTIVP